MERKQTPLRRAAGRMKGLAALCLALIITVAGLHMIPGTKAQAEEGDCYYLISYHLWTPSLFCKGKENLDGKKVYDLLSYSENGYDNGYVRYYSGFKISDDSPLTMITTVDSSRDYRDFSFTADKDTTVYCGGVRDSSGSGCVYWNVKLDGEAVASSTGQGDENKGSFTLPAGKYGISTVSLSTMNRGYDPSPMSIEFTTIIDKITISPDKLDMFVGDEKQQLTVTPAAAKVTWKSSDDTVATVDEAGMVSAVSPGVAVITATLDSDDTITASCEVTIDVAQGEAKIETKVQTDEKSPKLETSDLTQEVAESTLEDKEKAIIDEAVNSGKDVNVDVYLAIRDIADEITAEDKAKLEAEASDSGQLAYFDISLFKEIIVDGSSRGATAISELQKPLKLTIGVPNSFPAVETGYTRTYVVLRLHNGEVTTLPATVNADGTISFDTDRFSVYALAYKDIKDASTSDATTAAATTEASKTSPKTGDSMPIAVLVVLMLTAAGMLVFMDLKKKKN